MKITKLQILVGLAVLAASHASANLVVNGDFESGNTGFTSGYVNTQDQNGLATAGSLGGAGYYSIGTDPNYYHSSFASFGDHTSGTGNMMIVNGAPTDLTVWQETISLVAGQTYLFSAWVANVYPDSPASLNFSLGSQQIGSAFSATGVATWQKFSATFVAGSGTLSAVDANLELNGNDFALDDISLVPVPEASTIAAGMMLLLPFGISAVRILRKERLA